MLTAGFMRIINLALEHLKKRYLKKNPHLFLYQCSCKLVCHSPVAISHICGAWAVPLHSAKESPERNRDAPGPCLNCAVSATKLQHGIFCFPGQTLPLHKITAGGSNASVWSDSSPPLATEIQWTLCLLLNNHHRKPTGCQETDLVC